MREVAEHDCSDVAVACYQTSNMQVVRMARSHDDDVNIAVFHPVAGHGFIYGTKQGRMCVVGSRRTDFESVNF